MCKRSLLEKPWIVARLLAAGISLLAASSAFSQPVAVIAKGSFQRDFDPKAGSNPFKIYGTSLDSSVAPGAELVFLLSSRIGFGVEYLGSMRTRPFSEHYPVVTDEYTYFAPDGQLVKVSEPGKEFAGYTLRETSRIPTTLMGNVYLNILKHGRARPFIAGGYGVGFAEQAFASEHFYDPGFQNDTGFRFETPDYENKFRAHIIKAGGGVNVFAAGPLMFRVEGGYRNGFYAAIGIGVALRRAE